MDQNAGTKINGAKTAVKLTNILKPIRQIGTFSITLTWKIKILTQGLGTKFPQEA